MMMMMVLIIRDGACQIEEARLGAEAVECGRQGACCQGCRTGTRLRYLIPKTPPRAKLSIVNFLSIHTQVAFPVSKLEEFQRRTEPNEEIVRLNRSSEKMQKPVEARF